MTQESTFCDRAPELNGEPIERRPSLKYLGVIIDQKLNFGMHAELQAAKVKRAIGALWGLLGRWASKSHFQEIYSKKIMPLLRYALPVSCPTTRKHWEIMEQVHRFACRLATNNFTARYSDLLHELHWKPLARLCVERQILLIFKYLNGTRFLPEGTLELAPPQARQLRRLEHHEREVSVDTTIFHTPNHRPPRRALLGHAPFYFSVQEWNFLPREIAMTPEFTAFQRQLRDIETFIYLEGRQAGRQTVIPPLQGYYKNL
ncbi:MAG: hypothetical protein GY696_22215 [Gammaproteobacteria bacterium]|nr:hypothetical protein [Gammaproteobacteria bacterium]